MAKLKPIESRDPIFDKLKNLEEQLKDCTNRVSSSQKIKDILGAATFYLKEYYASPNSPLHAEVLSSLATLFQTGAAEFQRKQQYLANIEDFSAATLRENDTIKALAKAYCCYDKVSQDSLASFQNQEEVNAKKEEVNKRLNDLVSIHSMSPDRLFKIAEPLFQQGLYSASFLLGLKALKRQKDTGIRESSKKLPRKDLIVCRALVKKSAQTAEHKDMLAQLDQQHTDLLLIPEEVPAPKQRDRGQIGLFGDDSLHFGPAIPSDSRSRVR